MYAFLDRLQLQPALQIIPFSEGAIADCPLDLNDLETGLAVETAAFPPAEAATREKIECRLTVCPELCVGLFLRVGQALPPRAPQDIPLITKLHASSDDILIGHVISTKSENTSVRDEDMDCPPIGRTIALHALAISPEYQRSGFGKALMGAYINLMKQSGTADRISILTYDCLVPYYTKPGFEHYGKSESEYAGIAWHDLASPFTAIVDGLLPLLNVSCSSDLQDEGASLPVSVQIAYRNLSRPRWKYTEENMAEAILDVTDDGVSPPQAAQRRGVPRSTLVDRLNGRGAVKEQIHPHRRLSKNQEDRLVAWILRQESLGYAPSHSQIRACVMGLLRQQGEHPDLGRN
ncbi:hypothetical protein MRS44_013339 [Fusarium solani]|uniref:uncharacterized protein n=1 Tax=Fusarium solani TaxID=169388 RepID=UPI0032C45990|nr:hypothetical protein MRS44_013339 [Fusarium solani]